MDHYPPELHSYICSLACTDDGYTAHSLSLVSHYYAQISLPYQYQSIYITKPSQTLSLSDKLSNTPSHLRRIRHLFISDDGCNGERDLVNSIISIITCAAPTLETLTFIASSPTTSTSLIARLFRIRLPRLHELTISGHYPFPSAPSCSVFPSLERLHLLGNRNPHGLFSMGGLESVMPKLTHLRVSELNLAVSFSQEVQRAFASSSAGGDDGECMFPAKLPPKLQRLVVQSGPRLSSGLPNMGATRHKEEVMVKTFENLEVCVRQDGHSTRFSLLPRRTTPLSSNDLRGHWVDRLRGKEGCW